MKIKKQDTVIVLKGKDKGKTGKVLKVNLTDNMVIISDVNLKKINVKSKLTKEKGHQTTKEFPINISNVAFYDEKSKKSTRIGFDIKQNKKIRIAKQHNIKL